MAESTLKSVYASELFDLRGVVAVVTGGGTGIGLMITSTLAANGAVVYIIGPNQKDLDRTAALYNTELEKTSGAGKIYGLEGDIRKKAEAARLASAIGEREPYVTVLFNNAGILQGSFKRPTTASASEFVSRFFDDISQDDFENVINTNAVGPYWMTFAFLPLLEKWKLNGPKKFVPQVIMTSSMNGWTKDSATAGWSYPYMFSKSAIGHATSSLAHELLPLGIRVNGIAPGLFPSAMSMPGCANEYGEVPLENAIACKIDFEVPAIPTGGTRRDVGTLALFLVANHYVNGETVLIDGGTLLKHPSSY